MIRPLRERDRRGADPRLSVVLPVLDGGDGLGRLLAALAEQQLRGGWELIAVDSGSRDGSLERLLASPARVFVTPRQRFNHGATRNAAISHARAPFAVLLTQDAVPASPGFLEELVSPLELDPRLAGAYARQCAPPGADPLVVAALARWTPPGGDLRQAALASREMASLPPLERARRCRFDNVASCIRRSTWRRIPFPDLPFGEDAAWARRVLLAGHDLLYRGSTAVVHAHTGGPLEAFRRDQAAHAMLASEFGLRTVPGLAAGAAGWVAGWGSDLRDLRATGAEGSTLVRGLLRGSVRRLGAVAGQYVGGRRGRPSPVSAPKRAAARRT